MQQCHSVYNKVPVDWITIPGSNQVSRVSCYPDQERPMPAHDCPTISMNDKVYIRDDVFLEYYINAYIRYRCDSWWWFGKFGGNISDDINAIEVEVHDYEGNFNSGMYDDDLSTWLQKHPIDSKKITQAIQKGFPLNEYQGSDKSDQNPLNHTYTYLSGKFIAQVFRPMIPNSELLYHAQHLSTHSRFGAMVGLCLMIPELFFRTIANCTLRLAISINKIRNPIAAELQEVRYNMNQAAASVVFSRCLIYLIFRNYW